MITFILRTDNKFNAEPVNTLLSTQQSEKSMFGSVLSHNCAFLCMLQWSESRVNFALCS